MLPQNTADWIHIVLDDHRLVANMACSCWLPSAGTSTSAARQGWGQHGGESKDAGRFRAGWREYIDDANTLRAGGRPAGPVVLPS